MKMEDVADDGDRCRLVEDFLILTALLDDGHHCIIGPIQQRIDPNRPLFSTPLEADDGGDCLKNDLFLLLGEPFHEHLALRQHLLHIRPILHTVDLLRDH